MRVVSYSLGAALLLALSACGDSGGELFVEARTDLQPGTEFLAVQTVVRVGGETRMATTRAVASDDYIVGVRVAELGSLPPGDATVDVTLFDGGEQPLATRRTRLTLGGVQSMTVVITRSCRDVSCDAEQTCQSGACVDERCSPDNPTACGAAECAVDGDCTATGVCAGAACADGVCLQVPEDARCGSGERCSLDDGCVPVVTDAGLDAGADSGRDSAMDSGAPDSAVLDSGSDTGVADTGVDAGDPLTMPFGPATAVAALNTAFNDDDPTLSVDMLELFFATTRDGGISNIYTATRPSTADAWGTPTAVAVVNTSSAEANPMLSRDGRTLYFTRFGRIWQTRRSGTGAAWETPTAVDSLIAGVYTACPAPAADDRVMILCVQEVAMAPFALYLSTRPTPTAAWGTPMIAPSLNSASDDVNGYFGVPGGRLFFFTSDRPGGAGLRDLWYAERPMASGAFELPVRVPGVNTAADDENPWLSDDLRTIYFASDRAGAKDIYVATR